ncbi:hypothetical protein [Mucilaginibacter sp.]|jgi:hypothetical protein|uniref:hypothetical protein n=1 Tax=Mucilaginibacter sp. TaxID=1882438 RepID=UPI002BCC6F5E|nr:hypothetical protein [Mucilaginibacter sp.]HTI60772.1 hypothetical protein [Mucilaginibacter sp.]
MVRKTEKLELFCKKRNDIPTFGFAQIKNQITYKLWHDQFLEYPNVLDVHIKKMMKFSLSGINHPVGFSNLKKEVIIEIEDNLLESSNKFELRKYFVHIKNKLDDSFFTADYHVNDLKRVTFDLGRDDFENLSIEERAKYLIFHTCLTQTKDCFDSYLELQSFILEQENLHLNEPESMNLTELGKFSDTLSHKTLVLYELGIIDYLKREYFHPQQNLRNSTDLATLVAHIIGQPEKNDTIRKHISGIDSTGKDKITTAPGIKEVKKFLAQFDIDLKRLKDKTN